MIEIPNHTSPPYFDDSRADALFHYTDANGLVGIIQNQEIWSTAYHCSNDALELTAGTGILTPIFLLSTNKMIQDCDPLVQIFAGRGNNILEYAHNFEKRIIRHIFSKLNPYITCFSMPTGPEDFSHGLLSQWRAYGDDGGYALQFSRKKLLAAVENANKEQDLSYDLQDIHYTVENPLKTEVLRHKDSFVRAYKDFLKEMGTLAFLSRGTMPSPVTNLVDGPILSLLDYLIQTKNQHFGEERECRLSLIEAASSELAVLPTEYFPRRGLIVPYKKTLPTFPLLDCIEWIIIGPNPRMDARFKSVTQMVHSKGHEIGVRPSHIPFVRA